MVNKVTLIGNLGADPEVRRLESGAVVAKFSLATSENYKDKNTGEWKKNTEWHNVVLWRHLAENAERNLKKGSLIYLDGKLTSRSWESEGVTKYTTEVVGNYFRNLTKRDESSFQNTGNAQASTPAATSSPAPAPAAKDTAPAADDDLPF